MTINSDNFHCVQDYDGYVYIMQDDPSYHLIKIGYSKDPIVREKTLNGTGRAYDLEIIKCWITKDMKGTEKTLHAYFREIRFRKDKEFFDISQYLLENEKFDTTAWTKEKLKRSLIYLLDELDEHMPYDAKAISIESLISHYDNNKTCEIDKF